MKLTYNEFTHPLLPEEVMDTWFAVTVTKIVVQED